MPATPTVPTADTNEAFNSVRGNRSGIMSEDGQQDDSRSSRDVSRRRLIAASGLAAVSLGAAGCSQFTGGSESEDEEEDEDDDAESEETATETETATPTVEDGIRSISFGETREGLIDEDDGSDPSYGDLAEPVRLQAESGTNAVITMESADLDTYLILEGPDGEIIAEDDDGAEGFNSRIRTQLPRSGTYTIWAGTFSGTGTGPYTLTVIEDDPSERPDLESISFGQTREGYIDAEDGSDPTDGDLAEPVRLDVAGQPGADIRLESETLDTYLILEAPDGSIVGEDDDGGGGLNSRLRTQFEQSGTYTIWAGTFSGGDTGPYTLSVTESDPADREDLDSIAFGETRDGYIDIGDGNEPVDGDLAEGVRLDAEAGRDANIRLESETLDTYLILEAPDGAIVAEDDDGGGGLNSRIRTQLPQTGTYTIWATTFSGNGTGPYTLTVSEADLPEQRDLESITFGETRGGYIDNGDGSDPADGDLAEGVSLDAEAGTTAVISMESETLDTYLILEAPDGSIVGEDDDGGNGFNSRLRAQLPQTGTYTIWAGTFSGGDTGPYTLTVEQR